MLQGNNGVWIQHRHTPTILRGDEKKLNSRWSDLSSDGILANDVVITCRVPIDPVRQTSTV